MSTPFPSKESLRICFAHVAYALSDTFQKRGTGISDFQVWDNDSLNARSDYDVLVISGLWNNDILSSAPDLRFIQSIGAGYDQFPLEELRSRGIRLANASGVNKNAVSEHTFSLILSLSRHLKSGAKHQRDHFWRGMISEIPKREDELAGKTMGIVGMGAIGSRVAKIAKAFDMTVLATKRNPATAEGPADKVVTPDRVDELLTESDFLVLTCSLNDQTRGVINAGSLSRMKPTACLINMARGGCVDEGALVNALNSGIIAGAGLDVVEQEPLPDDSPLWDMDNVVLTPHSGGETQAYEDNVIDILLENVNRLTSGRSNLFNQVL